MYSGGEDFSFHNLKVHYQVGFFFFFFLGPLSGMESKIHWNEVQEVQRGRLGDIFSPGACMFVGFE